MAQLLRFLDRYEVAPPALPAIPQQKYQYEGVSAVSFGSYPDAVRYNTLQRTTAIQREAFHLARQLASGAASAKFETPVSADVCYAIFDCIDQDFPELLLGVGARMNLLNDKVVSVQYERPEKNDLERCRGYIDAAIEQLRGESRNLPNLDAARLIYQFVVGKLAFTTEVSYQASSALCLASGCGNSCGVAKLFQMLCNALGVRCVTKKAVVENKFTNYFNCVLLNGAWGNVDCALAIYMRKDDITMGYFCFPDTYLTEGIVVGEKPPCTSYQNMDFYSSGGMLASCKSDLQSAYKHVANCYLQGRAAADFLVLARDARADFDQICQSLQFGAMRYLEKSNLDVQKTNTNYYKQVPICRLTFTRAPLMRKTINVQISQWDDNTQKLVSAAMQDALKEGYRTIYLVFGQHVDYKAMEQAVCVDMFALLSMMQDVEEIKTFNYCGHQQAKVLELQF